MGELTVDQIEVVKAQYRYEVKEGRTTKTFPTFREADNYVRARNEEISTKLNKAAIEKKYPGGPIGKVILFRYNTWQDYPSYDMYEYWLYKEGDGFIEIGPIGYKSPSVEKIVHRTNRELTWWARDNEPQKIAAYTAAWECARYYSVDMGMYKSIEEFVAEMYEKISLAKKLLEDEA